LMLLDGVIVVEPNDFGAWCMKARCHQALDQNVEAIAAYGTAIALRPSYARAYLARAAIHYQERKHLEQALEDLNQAVKLQPDLLEARLDRGLVLHALNKNKEALLDLDWVLLQNNAPARVWFVRSRVKRAAGDVEGADQDYQRGLETEPVDPLSYVTRGMAKMDAEPEGALADFVKAEELYPRCVHALYCQAYVLCAKLKKTEQAITVLDRLLEMSPDHWTALSYRAILLARVGRIDDGIAEARKLIKRSTKPECMYRAACAFAIASDKKPELKNESLRALAMALYRGFGADVVDTDPDFDKIRGTPEFKQVAGIARAMRFWTATPTRQK
jgi:eukaryotic-like serine/threonine-protein kinase